MKHGRERPHERGGSIRPRGHENRAGGYSLACRRRGSGARRSGAHLRHGPESVEAGFASAHDPAAGLVRSRAGRHRGSEGQRREWRSARGHARGAVEFRALQRLLCIAARASRIFARICFSTMAPMRNTFAFRGESSGRTCWKFRTTLPFVDAAMVEPLACVLRGAHEIDVQRGRYGRGDRLRAHRAEIHPHSFVRATFA